MPLSILPPEFCDLMTKHHLLPFHLFTNGIAVKATDEPATLNPGSWRDELVPRRIECPLP